MSLVKDSALLRFDQHGIRPPYPKKAKRLITIVESGRDDLDSRVSPEIELQNQADLYTSDSDCENSTFEIDSDGYSNSDCESEGYKRNSTPRKVPNAVVLLSILHLKEKPLANALALLGILHRKESPLAPLKS